MSRKWRFYNALNRILFLGLSVALLVCALVLPASAAILDYNDYISNITVDGTYDNVTLKFPQSGVWFGAGQSYIRDELYVNLDSSVQTVYYAPFRYVDGSQDHLLRSDFPDDTSFEISFACHSQNVPSNVWINIVQYNESGNVISGPFDSISVSVESVGYLEYSLVTLRTGSIDFLDDCYSFCINYEMSVPGVQSSSGDSGEYTYWYYFWDADFSFSFKIDSLIRQQQNTNKQNAILNAVEKQLEANGQTLEEVLGAQQVTNDKLDGISGVLDFIGSSITDGFSAMGDKLNDLFTGGSAGDDLSGAAGDLSEDVGSVEDFQSGVESDLAAGFDEILDDFSGIDSLAPAFAFIGTYANKIFYSLDALQLVFILSCAIGVFLSLAQHVPRMPVLRSQDRRGSDGTRNSNWYDPVAGKVVDGNRTRGEARANRSG